MNNRQIKQSENYYFTGIFQYAGVQIPTTAVTVTNTSTQTYASSIFSSSIIINGIIYYYTLTLSCNYTAGSTTAVACNSSIVTVTDGVDIYTYQMPNIAGNATPSATTVTFSAIPDITVGGAWKQYNFKIYNKRLDYALAQQSIFSSSNTQTINFRIPISLFMSKGIIPQNTPIQLTFNINNNYINEIFDCIGVQPALYTPNTVPATQPNNSILLTVNDFQLYAKYETMPNIIGTHRLPLIQMQTSYRVITNSGNSSYMFNLPAKHVSYLIVGFLNNGRGSVALPGSVKSSSTRFDSQYTNVYPDTKYMFDATVNLINVRVQYAGIMKPSPDYMLDFTNTGGNNDNGRAFEEFLLVTQSRADRAASAMDIDMWQNCPLFVYKFGKSITDDNNVIVTVNLKSNYFANSSQIFLTALYNEDLVMEMDQGKLINASLIYE